jgi:hypothetical protein
LRERGRPEIHPEVGQSIMVMRLARLTKKAASGREADIYGIISELPGERGTGQGQIPENP